MSPATKSSIRDAAVGGVITVIGTLILTGIMGMWGGKESSADHKTDIQAVRADIQRVLDVVCSDHASARQCNQPPQP